MTAKIPPDPSDDALARIEQKLEAQLEKLEALSSAIERSNTRFENYQRATQWVVQLAVALIAIATITIIISSVLR
jgi:hypothetical protein